MSRHMLAAALLLSLGAAPALAQTAPAEMSPAARTLEQNQRAFIVTPPARPQPEQAAQAPAPKFPPVLATQPATGSRRLALADQPRRQ